MVVYIAFGPAIFLIGAVVIGFALGWDDTNVVVCIAFRLAIFCACTIFVSGTLALEYIHARLRHVDLAGTGKAHGSFDELFAFVAFHIEIIGNQNAIALLTLIQFAIIAFGRRDAYAFGAAFGPVAFVSTVVVGRAFGCCCRRNAYAFGAAFGPVAFVDAIGIGSAFCCFNCRIMG